MNREMIEAIIARLSPEERRIMSLPVQLSMHEDGAKAILIENWEKASNLTMKSLRSRGLTVDMRNARTGLVQLTKWGTEVAQKLSPGPRLPLDAPTWKCGHPRIEANTKVIRNGTGRACLKCFQAIDRRYNEEKRRA